MIAPVSLPPTTWATAFAWRPVRCLAGFYGLHTRPRFEMAVGSGTNEPVNQRRLVHQRVRELKPLLAVYKKKWITMKATRVLNGFTTGDRARAEKNIGARKNEIGSRSRTRVERVGIIECSSPKCVPETAGRGEFYPGKAEWIKVPPMSPRTAPQARQANPRTITQ